MKLGTLAVSPVPSRSLMPDRWSINVEYMKSQQHLPVPWVMEHGPEEGSLSHLGQGSTFGSQVLASPGCGEFPPRDHLLCRPDVPAEARPSGGNGLEEPGCWVSHSFPSPMRCFPVLRPRKLGRRYWIYFKCQCRLPWYVP